MIKHCQYQLNNCQKVANFQHFQQLGDIKLTKGYYACQNCKQIIEQQAK